MVADCQSWLSAGKEGPIKVCKRRVQSKIHHQLFCQHPLHILLLICILNRMFLLLISTLHTISNLKYDAGIQVALCTDKCATHPLTNFVSYTHVISCSNAFTFSVVSDKCSTLCMWTKSIVQVWGWLWKRTWWPSNRIKHVTFTIIIHSPKAQNDFSMITYFSCCNPSSKKTTAVVVYQECPYSWYSWWSLYRATHRFCY